MGQGFYGFPNILGLLRATSLKVLGKPGATAGATLAGGTTSGAPTSGEFDAGDAVVGHNGTLFVCTVAGSPGTWVQLGSLVNPLTAQGSLIQGASGGSPAELAIDTTAGRSLGAVGSDVAWTTPLDGSGVADPTTTDNDLLYRKKTTLTSLVIGFIGDSITLNAPSGGSTPPASCVADLSVNGLTVTASNQAVSGTSTSDWLPASTNLVTAKAAFASAGVRLVHIMLGTNDARVAVAHSATTFQSNLQSITSDLVGAGYLVALSYPPYCTPGSNSGDQDATANTLRRAYQAKINQICNGWTVRQADTSAYAYFAANSTQLSDGIHPSAAGASALAQMWANGLQRVVAALTQQTTLQRLVLGTNLSITTGTLNAAGGGYTDPLTTKGDLVARTASATTRQAVGADGTALVADSSQSTGMAWGTPAAQTSSPLVLLPNPYDFVSNTATDAGQPPDLITTAAGDVIGVGGM